MKTALGKLTLLAFVLAIALLMLAPMRSGIEDSLVCTVDEVILEPGESIAVGYELRTEKVQTVVYRSDDASVAAVDQRGVITAVSPGTTSVKLVAQGGAYDTVKVEVSGVPIRTFELNTDVLEMNKGDVSGLSWQFNHGAEAQQVTWSSENTDIVQVDAAGRVTAVGAGETRVTATASNGLAASALIRVNVRAFSAEIEPKELTVGVGAMLPLNVRFKPEDATDYPVEWKSSAPQVVAVDKNGTIRAVSVGTAVVNAVTKDGLSASVRVIVEASSKAFRLDAGALTVERGESRVLAAQFFGADGSVSEGVDHYVRWTSSDPFVAVVENGVVTGVASGSAVITAAADGFLAECEVTVQTSVQEIQLNVKEQTLYQKQADEPFLIRATVIPSDADDRTLTYSSDNPLVATVSQNGLVTMTGGYGTAVITVEAKSGATATCTINVVLPEGE